jgi:hypothetical protein
MQMQIIKHSTGNATRHLQVASGADGESLLPGLAVLVLPLPGVVTGLLSPLTVPLMDPTAGGPTCAAADGAPAAIVAGTLVTGTEDGAPAVEATSESCCDAKN